MKFSCCQFDAFVRIMIRNPRFSRAKHAKRQSHPEIPLSSPFDKGGKEGNLSKLGEPFDLAQDMLCELCAICG
jgi:hypothetical protein